MKISKSKPSVRSFSGSSVLGLAVVIALAAMLGGCAQPVLTYSGFLPDYSQLQVQAERPDSALWRKQGTSLATYKKVMVDPPMLYTIEKPAAPLSPDLKQQITDELRIALKEKLGASFLVVHEPGSDTLRVRAAITEVQPQRDNPFSPVEQRVPVLFTNSHMEAEVLDSLTAAPLLQLVDSRRGKNISVVQNQVRWESVRSLTREWAEALRQAITANP